MAKQFDEEITNFQYIFMIKSFLMNFIVKSFAMHFYNKIIYNAFFYSKTTFQAFLN